MPAVPEPASATPERHGGIQVVARVADVLRALADAPDGLTLSELAETVAIPKSTAHRLITALQAEDFVTCARRSRIHLGRELARLGAATRGGLGDRVRPFLVGLHQQLEETVDLSVLEGGGARFIDHIPASHRLRAVSAISTLFPLYCTANGKALLAAMAEKEVLAVLPSRLPALTPNTISSRKELLKELEEVRADGVAYDREEHTLGIRAVGAAISDPSGPAAAISIPVPAQRFAGNEAMFAQALRSACARCSDELGG